MEENEKQEKKLGTLESKESMMEKAKSWLIGMLFGSLYIEQNKRLADSAMQIDELQGKLEKEQFLSKVKDSEIKNLLAKYIMATPFYGPHGPSNSEAKELADAIINDIKDFRGNSYIRTSDENRQGNAQFEGEMSVMQMLRKVNEMRRKPMERKSMEKEMIKSMVKIEIEKER